MSDSCKTCKFHREFNEHGGHCHRYPPILFVEQDRDEPMYSFTDFPWISKKKVETTWCGEHKADMRKM